MNPAQAARFIYVDTAIGGVNHRNHVRVVSRFLPAPGTVDCFATVFRFGPEFIDYARTHRNAKGNPSVGGYPGAAYTPRFPLDFDCAADPSQALDDARRLIEEFHYRHDVAYRAWRCFFSGNKGFHLELPAIFFGGFEPSTDIAQRLKLVALTFKAQLDLDTLDDVIYEPLRLWRWPNSQHGGTGLHKIPLTADELLMLDLPEIRWMAKEPR